MNLFGWIFLGSSWSAIMLLVSFCFFKVFTEKDEEI